MNKAIIRSIVLGVASFALSGCMGGTQPTITKTTVEKVSPSAMKTYVVVTKQDKAITNLHRKAKRTIDAEMSQISRDSSKKTSKKTYSYTATNSDDRFSNIIRDRSLSN